MSIPNLMDYFPFSLPFDFYNTVRVMGGIAPVETLGLTMTEARQIMAAMDYGAVEGFTTFSDFRSQEIPVITVEVPEPFDYTFYFDLNEFAPFIQMIRWGILIMFTIALYKFTPMLIRW